MKRILKASVAGVLTCVIMLATIICAFAAPVSTVNGVEAPVGSTVEYTIDLVSFKQEVIGIQMFYKFDTSHLKLVSTDFSSFPSAAVNPNKQNDGMIYMNYSNPSELLDFSKPKEIGKLQFEVIAEGESNIEYYIQYIFDYDMVNIYDYTITYSLSVDGAEKIADKTPLLADINEVLKSVDDSVKFDVGDFENNVEGTGSGIKPTTAPKTNAPAADSGNNSGGGNNTTLFVIGGIVVLALIAVVIITVAKRKNTENE